MGYEAEFIGEGGKIDEVGSEFMTWANGRKVLFPVSNISLHTISAKLPESQKEVVVIYKTTINAAKISTADVYIFTSPSNVEGFNKENIIPLGTPVIAWGNSTKEKLASLGINVEYTLSDPSEETLIKVLDQLY